MYIHIRTVCTVHYSQICILKNYGTHPPMGPWTDLTLSMNSSNSGASRPFSTLAVGLPAKQPWQAASSKTLVRRTRRFSLNRRKLFFTLFASFFLLSKASRIIGCSSSTRSLHIRTYSKRVKQSVMSQRLRVYTVEHIAIFWWAKQNCWQICTYCYVIAGLFKPKVFCLVLTSSSKNSLKAVYCKNCMRKYSLIITEVQNTCYIRGQQVGSTFVHKSYPCPSCCCITLTI